MKAHDATSSPAKADYQPLEPHTWTATGMRPSRNLFGPTLWVREGEAQREIDRQKAIAERALNSLRSFDAKLADHIEGKR